MPLVGPDWMAKAEYPSVVLESGWYESAKALERDARLWQLGSEGAVRVVLQVKFSRPDQENDPIRVRLSINRTAPPGDLAHVKHYARLSYFQNSSSFLTNMTIGFLGNIPGP